MDIHDLKINNMKTEKEIKVREQQIKDRIEIMRDFLEGCYKGQDSKVKVEKELIVLRRQLQEIEWVIDRDLPF